MKIKKIHLMIAIMSIGHKYGFESPEHEIEYDKETGMFIIDKYTMVPMQHVKEVILWKDLDIMTSPDGKEPTGYPATFEDSPYESGPVKVAKKTWSRRKKVVAIEEGPL